MKKVAILLASCVVATLTYGELVLFRTSTDYVTTGEVIDDVGVSSEFFTTNVQEIAGLEISIRTDNPDHVLWANSRSFGVNAATNTDEAARFESGEKVIMSFNKDIEITYFDLRNFESGESFHFAVSNQPVFTIHHDAQDSTSSDQTSTNLFIAATIPVALYATTTGNVGFEALEITVQEDVEPLSLFLVLSNGLAHVRAELNGPATTNYVLQSSPDLTSNAWTTISGPFTSPTSWVLQATNDAAFLRVAPGE